MPLLQFKKPFKAAILSGRKTTTLRRWKDRRMQAGDRVTVPGVGYLILEAVEPVQWEKLTAADAKSDGFASLAELNRAIRRIYPNLDGDGKSWFRLKFRQEGAEPRRQLADVVRAELDKAVRDKGLYPFR